MKRPTSFASFAQPQGKVWRIDVLWEGEQSNPESVTRVDALKSGLRELGYAEGKNMAFEYRSAKNDYARLPALAAELLALNVDMIVVDGTPAAAAARNATREIPILGPVIGDPVGSGLAASLRRPGGNFTGFSSLTVELYGKRLDLLRQVIPGMRRAGFLYNPDNVSNVRGLALFESDCGRLGFKSVRAPVRKAEEIAAAFKTLQRDKVQGLIVASSVTRDYPVLRKSIIDLAAKHRLPAVYGQSISAEAGGLLSYAANFADNYRRAAAYADKIFKGAKPGDLPIEQPTTFEMVVNLKTAKALGIKIPNSILVRATNVIE